MGVRRRGLLFQSTDGETTGHKHRSFNYFPIKGVTKRGWLVRGGGGMKQSVNYMEFIKELEREGNRGNF